MAEPLLVEIVTYAPTAFYHCTHCEVAWHEAGMTHTLHTEQVASSLPLISRVITRPSPLYETEVRGVPGLVRMSDALFGEMAKAS